MSCVCTFTHGCGPMMLDVLLKIEDEQDQTLALRRSCRCAWLFLWQQLPVWGQGRGICGSRTVFKPVWSYNTCLSTPHARREGFCGSCAMDLTRHTQPGSFIT